LTLILSAVDENELLDLDLDDLEDLADALGEPFLDFFLLDFLGGFGMSGYWVVS
jgi:MinD-like ATPase involved in chromosome partitioning or flagellar assembly